MRPGSDTPAAATVRKAQPGDALLQELRRRGVPALEIGRVAVDNEVGNRFYQSLGFKLVRTERFSSNTRVNVYVLEVR